MTHTIHPLALFRLAVLGPLLSREQVAARRGAAHRARTRAAPLRHSRLAPLPPGREDDPGLVLRLSARRHRWPGAQDARRSRPVQARRRGARGDRRGQARAATPLGAPDRAHAGGQRRGGRRRGVALGRAPAAPATRPVAPQRRGQRTRGAPQLQRRARRQPVVRRCHARPARARQRPPAQDLSRQPDGRRLAPDHAQRVLPGRDRARHRGRAQAGPSAPWRANPLGR